MSFNLYVVYYKLLFFKVPVVMMILMKNKDNLESRLPFDVKTFLLHIVSNFTSILKYSNKYIVFIYEMVFNIALSYI